MKPLKCRSWSGRNRSFTPPAVVISAFAALCLLMPGPGRAAGAVASCTEVSLRAAMTGGGTVTFACDGTILLRNNLPINLYPHPIPITQNTVLDGTGHQITISGTNKVEGMFYVSNNVTLALVNLTLVNGLSTNGGSAIWIQSGTVCATNCTFIGNSTMMSTNYDPSSQPPSPAQGGAILNSGGNLNLQNCLFTSNSAVPVQIGIFCYGTGAGGAIFNTGSLIMDNCQLAQNRAAGGDAGSGDACFALAYGGAIYNSGNAVISRSSFISNSAAGGYGLPGIDAQGMTRPAGPGGDGGDAAGSAIYSVGSLQMQNSTVAANKATGGDGGPGGRRFDGGPPPPAGNGGSAYGAIYATGSWDQVNDTVALNSGYAGTGSTSGSAYGGCGGGFNTLLFSNNPERNDTFADPKLGPLADNGGPTWTMALLPGSPAIDAGSAVGAPATDQRGVVRPQGPGVDIGAFEYQYSPVFTGAIMINATNHLMQLSGLTSNLNLTLQVSSNLLNWADVTNFLASTNGLFQCVDPVPCNAQSRFYRLKSGTP